MMPFWILSLIHISLKDVVIKIGNWVEKGGRVLFALTLQKDTYVSLIEQKLGITDSDYGNVLVDKIYIDDDFMIGGGRSFQIPDAYDSAWEVSVGAVSYTHLNGHPVILLMRICVIKQHPVPACYGYLLNQWCCLRRRKFYFGENASGYVHLPETGRMHRCV